MVDFEMYWAHLKLQSMGCSSGRRTVLMLQWLLEEVSDRALFSKMVDVWAEWKAALSIPD